YTKQLQLLSGHVYPFSDVHGSGCCFAAAIASYIALEYPVAEAVKRGKEFVDGAIRYAVEYAPGRFTMNPGWRATTFTKIIPDGELSLDL
ncbi:MAG TPA: bifunctional hydroxymethylpyrimidine kinase/phosphomethylpyrimidine kinase, partial [Methanocorpusculum sp.]|nr:bifunctional hydroxymethylpyrimidine kinase/phosphomethylpyrimidine kinase [Methanocorpusculum sp.]